MTTEHFEKKQTEEQAEYIEERMKKSALHAVNSYDYKKLMYPNPHFIELEIEEEGEELILRYEVKELVPMTHIRKEDAEERLVILRNVAVLEKEREAFLFDLNPQNLYYDRNHLVYVKQRDIYETGQEQEKADWLQQYQALIGYGLQKQYGYADYKEGGLSLMKSGFLGKIRRAENCAQLEELLAARQEELETERRQNKILLNRGSYRRLRIALGLSLVLAIGGIAYLCYDRIVVKPYQEASLAEASAYIAADYVGCIDAMQEIAVDRMENYQKYMLANAYIRSENLTQEQKDNILKNLSLKENPGRLEYWIYLGRNDVQQAIDIAMQQSDDEMLLYAYMKQKSNIESDNTLSGEEKTRQLEEVAGKMQPLMEKYESEEEE